METEGKKPDVLVIGRGDALQKNLLDLLEQNDRHVEIARTAAQRAVSSAANYDVVFLDAGLRHREGDAIIGSFHRTAPSTPLILFTDEGSRKTAERALDNAEASFLLLEPFNESLLRSYLRVVDQWKHNRTQIEPSKAQETERLERLAAIGKSVAMVAHEARARLSTMSTSLEILPELLEQRDWESIETVVGYLKENERQLFSILEEIRDFAAPTHLEKRVFNLRSIWEQAWESLKNTRNSSHAELKDETDGTDLDLPLDPCRMEQVFRNLFENSIAASDAPVNIRITTPPQQEKDSLLLVIEDNGPGMNREQQHHVFEPFFTTKSRGTGLGMAIVKQLMEAHGGQITVGRDNADGAQFRIRLPRQENTKDAEISGRPSHDRAWPDPTQEGETSPLIP